MRRSQKKHRVSFEYADESDRGPYPIPRNVKIEGGRQSDGDRHALILDRDNCRLYELFALYPTAGGGWRAGSGAVWNLRSNPPPSRRLDVGRRRRAADPPRPGPVRRGRPGPDRPCAAFTVRRTRRAYVYPARHYASDSNDPNLPPMGLRLRLKASYPTRGFPRQARIVLEALKRYGMLVADNGSDWYLTGAPDPRWSNDQLHTLHRVPGSAFEVVQTRR